MLKKVFSFFAEMAALFLLLNGSIWLLSHWMFQEKKTMENKDKGRSAFSVEDLGFYVSFAWNICDKFILYITSFYSNKPILQQYSNSAKILAHCFIRSILFLLSCSRYRSTVSLEKVCCEMGTNIYYQVP